MTPVTIDLFLHSGRIQQWVWIGGAQALPTVGNPIEPLSTFYKFEEDE